MDEATQLISKKRSLDASSATNGDKSNRESSPSKCSFMLVVTFLATLLACTTVAAAVMGTLRRRSVVDRKRQDFVWNGNKTKIAFLGNSMLYFNDFPRFFEVFSGNRITQNSCLHGAGRCVPTGSRIPTLYIHGNAMYPQFHTTAAIIDYDSQDRPIYDYGACTVPQLLVGYDERLHDPGYAQTDESTDFPISNKNPCRVDPAYLEYTFQTLANQTPTNWDFVLINDFTRNPARFSTRHHSLAFLEMFYVPLLLESGATPVFLWTHAYSVESTPERNMTGLTDVANFTSLTAVGYREYTELLELYLPAHQKPKTAPVGLAFLVVYEENYGLWKRLFHVDHIHASPSGTFLQGCIVYCTLFGEMPPREWAVRRHMAWFWRTARMMQHAWEPPNPYPTRRETNYLYDVAERVMVDGYVPPSYIRYENGVVAYENPS